MSTVELFDLQLNVNKDGNITWVTLTTDKFLYSLDHHKTLVVPSSNPRLEFNKIFFDNTFEKK